MFLKHRESGDLLRILDVEELFNPLRVQVRARDQSGEEEQDPAPYPKDQLVFPSGERLPRCWVDPAYRSGEMKRVRQRGAFAGHGHA